MIITSSPIPIFKFSNLSTLPKDIEDIVFPLNTTGSTFATGVIFPNTPTENSTSNKVVFFCSGGNLNALSYLFIPDVSSLPINSCIESFRHIITTPSVGRPNLSVAALISCIFFLMSSKSVRFANLSNVCPFIIWSHIVTSPSASYLNGIMFKYSKYF